MKFTTQITVRGIKANVGKLEDGTSYDSTKIFVDTELDASKGKAKGSATVEYTFGKSDEFEKMKHLPLPVDCEAELEIITSGKVQKTVITSLKPIAMTKAKAA